MEEYKKETISAYALDPRYYEEKFSHHRDNYALTDLERFLKELKGPKVLDMGCGPGVYMDWFRENGVDAMGVDLSDAFLEACNSKGLNVRKMDIEQPLLYPHAFDGIWAQNSLLHVPRERVPKVIETWGRLLKKDGLLFISVLRGGRRVHSIQ